MPNVHYLTSHSTPCCLATQISSCGHRLLWRHFTLCIKTVLSSLSMRGRKYILSIIFISIARKASNSLKIQILTHQTPKIINGNNTQTRHRANISMYSLTFCVRFLLPERHQRKPAVQAAAVMLAANHRRASHAHFPYTARNFENAPPVTASPLPSNRHNRRCGDCLEGKGENYQVCSLQYCVQQLCTVRCTHIW